MADSSLDEGYFPEVQGYAEWIDFYAYYEFCCEFIIIAYCISKNFWRADVVFET